MLRAAWSRKDEWSLFLDQTMKPTSLANAIAVVSPVLSSVHQRNDVVESELPRNMPRNSTPDIANADTRPAPKAIANHGII